MNPTAELCTLPLSSVPIAIAVKVLQDIACGSMFSLLAVENQRLNIEFQASKRHFRVLTYQFDEDLIQALF